MLKILKIYNIRYLKKRINIYGYTYNYKDFITHSFMILGLIYAAAYFSRVESSYLLVLFILGLVLIPIIILAWFKNMYNIQRFEMLSDYLSNIIPIFSQLTNIKQSLFEVRELCGGEMQHLIDKSLIYLERATNDSKMSKTALEIIENEFKNSRIKSVHKFMIDVEKGNSVNFKYLSDNLYNDTENWIKRTYTYQKDLKDIRSKLIILSLFALFINGVFTYVYSSNEVFADFIKNPVYQLSTTLFISLIAIAVTVMIVKLNGSWLVDDIKEKDENKLKQIYVLYKTKKQNGKIEYLVFVIIMALAIYIYLLNLKYYACVLLALAVIMIFKRTIDEKKCFRKLRKYFYEEFPMWLRNVSLSISYLTVLNSIENSVEDFSYPLRKELRSFIGEAVMAPTSIKPYNSFLEEYDVEDVRSSMRILYSLNNSSSEEMQNRLSNLIDRNQELLAKSEVIKNRDSLGTIEFIGYIPALLLCGETLVSMATMLTYIIDTMGVV